MFVVERDEKQELVRRFGEHLSAKFNLVRGRYNPAIFQSMIEKHGDAVAASKRLLVDSRPTSYGFERLWELNKLECSVEFAACLPWFEPLFSDEEIRRAERRLLLHEFPLQEHLDHSRAHPPSWWARAG